jgi:outer membrane biosynthesis protein TonB
VSRSFKHQIGATLMLVACACGAQQLQSPATSSSKPGGAEPNARKAELRARLDEIEGRIQKELGERVKYISPSSGEEPFRTYYRRFTERVEVAGTANFPKKEGASVYGKVHLLIYVGSNGRIQKIHTVQTDSAFLENHAIGIVRSTAPLEPFSPEMRHSANSVVMSASFNYTRD